MPWERVTAANQLSHRMCLWPSSGETAAAAGRGKEKSKAFFGVFIFGVSFYAKRGERCVRAQKSREKENDGSGLSSPSFHPSNKKKRCDSRKRAAHPATHKMAALRV